MTKFESIFLENMTRDELRRIASLLGIKYSPMTKDEMLQEIIAYVEGGKVKLSFTGKAIVHGATAIMKSIAGDVVK